MPIFYTENDKRAHQRFGEWIEANPDGFVINRKNAKQMMLHSVQCGHFKPFDWANETSNLKACSNDRIKLEYWAEVEGATLKLCGDCLRR